MRLLPLCGAGLTAAIAACTGGARRIDTASAPAAGSWAAVDSIVRAAIAGRDSTALGLAIYDARDRLVFRRMYGGFTPDRRVAIASASKRVASLVFLDLAARGELPLDATTGRLLGWQGTAGGITVRHLLSFTSGLKPDHPCTANPVLTLEECVVQIGMEPRVAEPGTRFDYGSTHLAVAANMAERATGRPWNRLFRERLADPLRLPPEVQFFTAARYRIGGDNPLVAAGMRASMDEYAPLLALAFHRGVHAGLTIASPALFDEQARMPYPRATLGDEGDVPLFGAARYGLGAWLECAAPATGCGVLSSAGALGFMPWLDREAGYYAIIGMEEAPERGAVTFSFMLAHRLRPAIRAALGAGAQP